MQNFSQRKGIKPILKTPQIDSINDDLKNSIWNVLNDYFWEQRDFLVSVTGDTGKIAGFSDLLWKEFFKKPTDERPWNGREILQEIKNYYFSANYNEIYDFLEFVVQKWGEFGGLVPDLNRILERELSGYRIVEGVVAQITDEQETEMLKLELNDSDFPVVKSHLKRALELLSDRNNPDYRNSIKESISAVEAISRIAAGNEKATLSDALKVLGKNGKLHPALKDGFTKLYGYTNDGEGIRHAMLSDESSLSLSDARYFLLSCISFINYIKSNLPEKRMEKS